MRIILIVLVAVTNAAAQEPGSDSVAVVRRIATTARLAAEEYGLGVVNGKVINPAEVEEAGLFLGESRKAAASLPSSVRVAVEARIDSLIALVDERQAATIVTAKVEALVGDLSRQLQVTLDELPGEAPSLDQGRKIFALRCVSCHGSTGRGDGPAAQGMNPPPANLADSVGLRTMSPLDFYRRITIGIAGTAMASYEHSLSPKDRWAVALYASTLRLPAARGSVPSSMAAFEVSATLSDQAILDSLKSKDLALVAAVRSQSGDPETRDWGPLFEQVRSQLDQVATARANGQNDEARTAAIAAYMTFEAAERYLRVKDRDLVTRMEGEFASLRDETDPDRSKTVQKALSADLERAERAMEAPLGKTGLFLESLLILVREGVEAILVIGALLAFLTKVGARDRRRDIHLGIAAAILMSLATAVVLETVFRSSAANREALEGIVMAVAAVLLFFVSYWLISKTEAARWNRFVRQRMTAALNRRSMLALASVAFFAVYREGFETVLFYKALSLSGGASSTTGPIVGGIVVGSATLAVLYLGIVRFGVRIPLKPFFAATGGILYFMAFIFGGSAVAELQEGGVVPITPIREMVRIPALGIYPTVQSVAVQGAVLLLGLFALGWTFFIGPRRARPRAPRPIRPGPTYEPPAASEDTPQEQDRRPARVG